jgi:hypothetical protein
MAMYWVTRSGEADIVGDERSSTNERTIALKALSFFVPLFYALNAVDESLHSYKITHHDESDDLDARRGLLRSPS